MKRLIPFRLMPGSWGLRGQIYREAEAAYYYEGEELERALAVIRYEHDPVRLRKRQLEISWQHGKISDYDYDVALLDFVDQSKREFFSNEVEFKHGNIDAYTYERNKIPFEVEDGTEREIAILDLDHRHGKISEKDFEKGVATLRGEPWVGVINDDFDVNHGVNGFQMELDWNTYMIDYLRLNGYEGTTEEEIIEQWFSDVARSPKQYGDEIEVPVTLGDLLANRYSSEDDY